MMNTDAKNIWVIGDIHGSYLPIENFYRRNKLPKNNNVLIILGDFGGNYFLDQKDDFFKKKLKQYNFTYFVIRGNHEARPSVCAASNPDSWHIETYFNNTVYVENKYPYIKYALDEPAVYDMDGFKTLIIPGAYSPDKEFRLAKGWNWFKDEQLSEEEMNTGRRIIKENNYKFDLVLSHTCPIIYEPKDLFLSSIDQSTVDKKMEQYLGEIEYKITYYLWLWGHFHAFRTYHTDGKLKCLMLDYKKVINIKECINILSKMIKTY